MRDREAHDDTLAGSLLLAHPSLSDANFRRAVVLLSAHDDEGAMGVVLNRPVGQTLAGLDESFARGALANVPVYSGGPVQTDRLVICALGFHANGEGLRLHFGLDPDDAEKLIRDVGNEVQLRAFVGYSGWSAGQLENELKHDTWAVSPIPSDLMDFKQDETLWRGVLSRMGPEWKLLAGEPDDMELN
jgi:putative transcriptional regulator